MARVTTAAKSNLNWGIVLLAASNPVVGAFTILLESQGADRATRLIAYGVGTAILWLIGLPLAVRTDRRRRRERESG